MPLVFVVERNSRFLVNTLARGSRFGSRNWADCFAITAAPRLGSSNVERLVAAMRWQSSYNADKSLGPSQLLFAVNPDFEELVLPLGGWMRGRGGNWRIMTDFGGSTTFRFATI